MSDDSITSEAPKTPEAGESSETETLGKDPRSTRALERFTEALCARDFRWPTRTECARAPFTIWSKWKGQYRQGKLDPQLEAELRALPQFPGFDKVIGGPRGPYKKKGVTCKELAKQAAQVRREAKDAAWQAERDRLLRIMETNKETNKKAQAQQPAPTAPTAPQRK